MPRRKKRPLELTNEEALRKLFPKPVREEAKKTALNSRKRPSRRKAN